MLQDILFAIWFLLPAAASNAAPVFVAAIPFLKKYNAPIDGGKKLWGHPVFGPHKTWRGIIAGIVVATLLLAGQQFLFANFEWVKFISGGVDYASLPTLLLGPLFAIGALGGDAIESFFKRQQGIKSGGKWIPFDQIDYIIGSVLISLFFVVLTPVQYFLMFIIWFLIHILSTFVGYKMGLKKDPI